MAMIAELVNFITSAGEGLATAAQDYMPCSKSSFEEASNKACFR